MGAQALPDADERRALTLKLKLQEIMRERG